MIVTYDPLLVVLSVVIAVFGSYTGLRLARRMVPRNGSSRKAFLAGSAMTIGVGIWSMHFVGMLAVHLPVTINYDVLLTLVSALLAILVTGIGLSIASYGRLTVRKLAFAGIFMGLGISTMHYVGMAAVRANCSISYGPGLVIASVLIGIAASTLALWLAFNLEGLWRTIAAAVVMGVAISGMHYTAMAAATFLPVEVLIEYAAPALSPNLLAIVVAVTAFLICGMTLLMALPDRPEPEDETAAATAAQIEAPAQAAAAPANGVRHDVAPAAEGGPQWRLPVQRNKTTIFLDLDRIVGIRADAHYTCVYDGTESYFCSLSLSELEARLDPAKFLRVHRSYIVNIRHAESFERHNEQGLIHLTGTAAPSVPVSRRNVHKLRSALGLAS
jgi:NO-binding membrane sensor protein with MHYT domain